VISNLFQDSKQQHRRWVDRRIATVVATAVAAATAVKAVTIAILAAMLGHQKNGNEARSISSSNGDR